MKNLKRFNGYLFFFIFQLIGLTGCQDQANSPSPGEFAEYTLIDYEPAWTLSGNKIAYAHSNVDHDLNGIYSVNPDGSNNVQLISETSKSPDWSPDDSRIVFTQFNDIYISHSNGDSIIKITDGSSSFNPNWSSDNEFIAYSRSSSPNHSDIYVIRPDGSENTLIDINGKYPSWTDGSNSLIYFKPVFDGNSNTQIGDSLVQYFFINGNINTIAVLIGDQYKINMYPNMTSDGIIFCAMNNKGYMYIYKIDLNKENIYKLTDSQGFSPDYCSMNHKIVYTNRNKGNGRLWIMDTDGSNKTQITY